ncbi:MAG: PDDEXK nuclease domain-containing protein [candidate division WOR-3 bacterium]|nr:PDDEXK nuclease domain-containing protein [candidate division WOR-3 bacterium]MDH5684490.1 PDDEXK nuclease domain-containing protein [candidate division WOR-3 bacterium]
MKNKGIILSNYSYLFNRIAEIIAEARTKVVREINTAQVLAYWEIGREIVEFEQKGKLRAVYGEALIVRLAKDMTERFGKGFSERNLRNMRTFYLNFPIRQTLSAEFTEDKESRTPTKLEPMVSWSHYCELLKIEEPLARSFYEREAIQNNWSVRELKRQINSMLFERLALSKDTKAVMKMAKKGQVIEKPEDAIKDPYVLEFLNLKEETSYSESQLEQALIDKLQDFLLELGKGFTFVARQRRITIVNRHYRIDLVFYNRLLKCFLLIDLKTGELDHADVGQMNFYLNYFRENEKAEGENNPIGLILCAQKDNIFAKYVLGGLNNKVFASKYKLALPSEKELRLELKSIPGMLVKDQD